MNNVAHDDRRGADDRGHAVRWDVADMTTRYGLVPGAEVGRGEISLLVAERTVRTGKREETVVVSDRIILNPFTAKRLLVLLGTILARQELRSRERTGEGPQSSERRTKMDMIRFFEGGPEEK